MPGMSTGLNANNPSIVSAFQSTLLHQGLVVLLILAIVATAWNLLRSAQLRQANAGADGGAYTPRPQYSNPEPAGRRLLRISFGIIWIFDGLLQAQSSMPLGMPSQVIEPAAASSPSWIQHLDNAMATTWSYHPISAPASAVWIQIGVGVWLLAASKGIWSRLAGVASVAWGLIVWIFGEAFGQVFAPGQSWMFGLPGAVLFYCAAGVLIALPETSWATPRLGRWILRAIGLFWVGMALLQAWPGRGFWQGQATRHASPGSLTSMVQQMATTPQPHLLSSWVASFASFDAAHGWAVNLFVVIALAVIGLLFISGRPRPALVGVVAGTVVCVADWLLVQDLGFMGGVGTDPNSMIPMVLVFTAGYLALTRAPVATEENGVVPITPIATRTKDATLTRRMLADPTYTLRSVVALGAIGVILVGAVPMGLATLNPRADPILAQAIDGTPGTFDHPAPAFSLVDQYGTPVSLASLRGKTVALTFLDDVCTTDCPVIAQEFRVADGYLGAASRRVEMVAINANPRFVTPDYLAAFDHQEGLENLPNWRYLTGSLQQLRHVWASYGEAVVPLPAGAMIGHSEFAYVIDASGDTRFILDTDPGPATEATRSSFSEMLANSIESAERDK
ncbi:MAG TPA: SCO family protein [Acidimicrobiales bacterium]|nr:SCO family protein [Acidimicrobiales bacterium]